MDNRMADYRRMRRMSLDDLSEASGLAKSTLSELERGITRPTLDSARRIARALDAYESELWLEDSTMPLTVRATDTALAAAEARIAELEADNEHLLKVNAGLQKKLEGLIPALRDCVTALKLACRERTPAARRAAALLKEKE